MSDNQARVSVRILEKEYHITCPMEERSDLARLRRVPEFQDA